MKVLDLRSRALIDVELGLLAWFLLAAGTVFGQSPPLLQVTSPPDGTVVHPGDTVTIVVTPSTGVSFAMVALFGEGGLTKDQVLASPPYQFSITVPKNLKARKYQLHADGAISRGQGSTSPPVSLDVEPGAPCAKITVQPNHMLLESSDLPHSLQVKCAFADGTSMDVTESSQIRYTSFNTSVATVDQHGRVKSAGPGTTTITASFNGQMAQAGTLIEVPKPKPSVPSTSSMLSSASELSGWTTAASALH